MLQATGHPARPMLDHCLVRVLDAKCGGHVDAIRRLLIIQPEGLLVSMSVDMVIKVWDYTKGLVLWEIKHEAEDLTCMAYDYGKRNLVCGTEDCTLITIDLPNPQRLLRKHEGGGDNIEEDLAGHDVEEGGGRHVGAGLEGEEGGQDEGGGEVDDSIEEAGGEVDEEHELPAEEQP